MKLNNIWLAIALLTVCTAHSRLAAETLEAGFANPPRQARLRAYWWWLNGNVTKASITRDLEEMAAKGFGGALICDADGASQDGNDTVPHGPDFFSAEWRELYRHTLREADRLGLEMSLNIQSGWNLGGPMVKAEDAAKKLVWSEAQVAGPGNRTQQLPLPSIRDGFYQDLFVVAFPLKKSTATNDSFIGITASSARDDHRETAAADGKQATFWVSRGVEPGEGPSRSRPEWLELRFRTPIAATSVSVLGRPGYGPRDCELRVSDDGTTFRTIKAFSAADRLTTVEFDEARARHFRLVVLSSFDPRHPESPRNVQIAEFAIGSKEGFWPAGIAQRRTLQNWENKAMHRALHFSAPDTTPLLVDIPAQAGEQDTTLAQVVDLTDKLDKNGVLRWEVPSGEWHVLRFGCTIGDHSKVSTSSDGWKGFALDVLDAGAFQRYWNAVVEPLIADAGPLAGKTLKYLHTDSWEVEAINWTPHLREEFRARRGYDLLPFMPMLAGRIVESRPVSNRFLNDFRKTLGDLAIDNHYRLFRDDAHKHGMLIHPESGGPHAVPVDAQRCLGWNDMPMSEFWAWSWRHRVGESNRFFVKQPASAAHTYGRRYVAAEGFTTIGPHWQETLWNNLKPSFDRALCEGLNLLVWHAFTCSPAEMGLPGQEYFAGTHFNPNSTWWSRSKPFLSYINRCQWMLQQGLFVADACYYYGDHVPNFAQLKRSDPARVLPGYDYDVVTEEVLLTRMSVRQGRLTLPDGMSYRVLALPNRTSISLPVLRKLKELVANGATVIGPKPETPVSLTDFPKCDLELAKLSQELWANTPGSSNQVRHIGQGRIFSAATAREVLLADGILPDFEFSSSDDFTTLDYIHRRNGDADIYFIANRSNRLEEVRVTLRVTGKTPEIWDPVSGQMRDANSWSQSNGRTTLPLTLNPYGSVFVVFRRPAPTNAPVVGKPNFPKFAPRQEISGPWSVHFDPQWGGPKSVDFPELVSWTTRPEAGIKYYSGTATYRKRFDLVPELLSLRDRSEIHLDLGQVYQLAEVRLNGHKLGVLWSFPFQIDVTRVLKPAGNELEIDIVNFWPNRVIGDQSLPAEQRRTRTNIRKLTKDTPLVESGLLGPVRLVEARWEPREEPAKPGPSALATQKKITVASYYFPNYHTGDPRNEKQHGKGWNEWDLVKNAKPRFPGHEQPKAPLWNYANESDPQVMAQKIAAAADHGIDAFIYDWYFYEDGPFLQRGLEEGFMIATNHARLKFGLMWANHDWVEIFPARAKEQPPVLYPGKMSPQGFDRMVDYVIKKYFKHSSYWCIEGKPYFSVYELGKLVENFGSVAATRTALEHFRKRTTAAGLPGLHLNAVVWGQPILPAESTPANPLKLIHELGFDSATSYTWAHHCSLDWPAMDYLKARNAYLRHYDHMLRDCPLPYFPNISMGWDPTPRTHQDEPWVLAHYPFTGVITGNTPAAFRAACETLKDRLLTAPTQLKIVTINCWNEWTEGSYLEPDRQHGMAYLEAVQAVFGGGKNQ